MIKLRAGRLALCLSALLALLALSAGVAAAATPGTATPGTTTPGTADNDTPSFGGPTTPELQNKVTFIGDSVTAGFGYCGYVEHKKDTTKCKTNQEMDNSWGVTGENGLGDCAPKDEALASDACSNNNYKGKPWLHAAWEAGDNAPNVAYPFQIAARQKGDEKAEVSDWAMTGSTPDNWDPVESGAFSGVVGKLKNQYVGMTLGANPLLAYFTKIKTNVPTTNVEGKCVFSTFKVESAWSWLGYGPEEYAGPISNAVECLKQQWNAEDQTQHLVNLYTTLLEQNDKVVVMGYYRDCSWSFGNWQPNANFYSGPASGKDCKSQTREISKNDSKKVSQWEQAIAVGSELNNLIHDAVDKAKAEADKRWGPKVADDLVYTQPNEADWEKHQPTSNDSWIFKNDTWIHPSKAGDTNLADTMTAAMCEHFDRWCDSGATWAK
ncbi:MAG TPA: hypothetical protein VJ204_15390 [Solirubrobacterales bacterium]|nr:hypothetical protein [Solirubrobacterales bacterium]